MEEKKKVENRRKLAEMMLDTNRKTEILSRMSLELSQQKGIVANDFKKTNRSAED